MEWLLTLCAMLSAVTGAFSGAREAPLHAAEAATSVQAVAAVAEQAVVRAATLIPEDGTSSDEVQALPDFALIAAVPLYRDRLIE